MMRSVGESRLGRGFLVLAPPQAGASTFGQAELDSGRHARLMASSQRLRGRIYRQDGAIKDSQLTLDGRHTQPADDVSWHILTVDRQDRVTACLRYMVHPPCVRYSALGVSQVTAVQPGAFGSLAERAVIGELEKASRLGFAFVELGGWVVGEELRCSTEAIRIVLITYALSQLMGGAIGLTTATTRHSSSAILRRTGGTSLSDPWGAEVPSYFDPFYNCEMELLGFDSRHPNPRYSGWIREFRTALLNVPIIVPSSCDSVTMGLCHLQEALADSKTVTQHSTSLVA